MGRTRGSQALLILGLAKAFFEKLYIPWSHPRRIESALPRVGDGDGEFSGQCFQVDLMISQFKKPKARSLSMEFRRTGREMFLSH